MQKTIKLILTRKEAEALMDAGNRGVADLEDCQDDEADALIEPAERALSRMGTLMREAGWNDKD